MHVTLDLVGPIQVDPRAGVSVSAGDVRLFDSFMSGRRDPPENSLSDFVDSMSGKFQSWRQEWLGFGDRLDVADHSTAVRVLEQQAKLTGQSLHFQFTLQTAESVRHGFKTLYQQQA